MSIPLAGCVITFLRVKLPFFIFSGAKCDEKGKKELRNPIDTRNFKDNREQKRGKETYFSINFAFSSLNL